MRRERAKPYLLLLASLFLIITLPLGFSEKIRGTFMEVLHPVLSKLSFGRFYGTNLFTMKIKVEDPFSKVSYITGMEEIKKLELENKLLYANFIQLLDLL